MTNKVKEARTAVNLAMQTYGVAVRFESQTLVAWDAVQEKIDALIAAVRAESAK